MGGKGDVIWALIGGGALCSPSQGSDPYADTD